MIVGAGEYRFELVEDWEQIPDGMSHPDVASVRYSPETGDVFLFCRSQTPVMRYSKAGEFRGSWGGDRFTHLRGPHGMYLLGDGTMLLIDTVRNSVERYSYDGQRLESIPSAEPAPAFDKPTCAVVHPNGSVYVTDGYGNSFLHRFTEDGTWLATWGRPGDQPLEFAIPHAVTLDPEGNLLVSDRENHRIQVISPEGEHLRDLRNVYRPSSVRVQANGDMFVAELGADTPTTLRDRPVPSRITVLRPDGSVAMRFGEADGVPGGNFVAAHDLCVDDEGSLYVAEVTETMGIRRNLVPPGTHSLQKFARL